MMLDLIKMMSFKTFALPFLALWPPTDAPLQMTIVSFTKCINKKINCTHVTPTFLIHFQKAIRAVRHLNHCYKKELDEDEAKIFFYFMACLQEWLSYSVKFSE